MNLQLKYHDVYSGFVIVSVLQPHYRSAAVAAGAAGANPASPGRIYNGLDRGLPVHTSTKVPVNPIKTMSQAIGLPLSCLELSIRPPQRYRASRRRASIFGTWPPPRATKPWPSSPLDWPVQSVPPRLFTLSCLSHTLKAQHCHNERRLWLHRCA